LSKAVKQMNKFLLFFLFANPFLDIISGIYNMIAENAAGIKFAQFSHPITPSLVVRMAVLLLFAVYALIRRDKTAIMTAVPIAAAWALSVVGEFLFAESFSLYTDAQYIAKFCFNIAAALILLRFFSDFDADRDGLLGLLNRVINFTLLLLAGTLVICYIFDFGYRTYGDRFGYFGFRGIYYSGNDITSVFMSLLPLSMGTFIGSEIKKPRDLILPCLAPVLTIESLLIIGTKTAFISVIGSAAALLCWCLYRFFAKKEKLPIIRYGILAAAFAAVFGLLLLFSNSGLIEDISSSIDHTGMVFEDTDLTSTILSGRQHKLAEAFGQYKNGGVFRWIFGIGRGTQLRVIEMDIFEVVIYYGLFGALAMLWLYLKLGVDFLIGFFRKIDTMGVCLFVAIGMCTAYMAMAGHVLFSPTSGFYYVLILAYAKVYYTPDPRDIRLIKKFN